MSSKGVGPIVFIEKPQMEVLKDKNRKKGASQKPQTENKWSKEVYFKILRENLIREGKKLCGEGAWRFVHDGDTTHTSHIVVNWLKNNGIMALEWPANSPDLNPVSCVIYLRLKTSGFI